MMDCIFCRIISGEIPAKFIQQDELCVVFADMSPQAPVHLLVVPRRHISSLAEARPGDEALLGHLLATVAEAALAAALVDGYRTVINTGEQGGQTVGHLHIHVLGGRQMHWPPG